MTKEERDAALRQAHDADVAGHWKQQETWMRLKKSAYWPGYAADTSQYVATCHACQMRSSEDLKVRAPMGTLPYPVRPFRLVAVDLKQLPESADGDKWMAVAVCQTTKFVEAAPMRSKQAECVAEFLFKEVFARYGFVRYMLTDRGKEFQNEVAKILSAKLGISQRFTSPYRPQANGTAERTIGIIADRLATSLREGPNTWPTRLPAALMAIRTSVNFSTGFAPLALLTGRDFVTPMHVELNGMEEMDEAEMAAQADREEANQKASGNLDLEFEQYVANYQRICNPKLPFFLDDESDDGYTAVASGLKRQREPSAADAFVSLKKSAAGMRAQAKKNVKKKVAENKRYYDKVRVATLPRVSIGSLVLLRRGQFATRMHGRLGYRYAGPFAVVSADVHTVTILDADNKRQKVNRDNVKPYRARAPPAP